MAKDFITCPRCGWTSFNPSDVEQRYCGNCHMFHSDMKENNPMATFHFKPELIHLLKWFKDSPDTGDPECICSYCAKVIEEADEPIRAWRGKDKDTEELRLHITCAKMVVVEWSPKESQYIQHSAFPEGQEAFKIGLSRGSNPYSKLGPQRFRDAWYAGWDDAWAKRDGAESDEKI